MFKIETYNIFIVKKIDLFNHMYLPEWIFALTSVVQVSRKKLNTRVISDVKKN